jgi:hypothetical protein
MLDNRWVIPYNPFMSATFGCHINVECAVSFASVKYVSKYICKGHDRATMQVNSNDEITRFIDGRYLSPSQSVWRILQFHIHEQHPLITRLQVHLPGQHLVTFDPDEDPQSVLERAANERTTLTAFFAANMDAGTLGIEARKYTYPEFPQHFTWKAQTKSWETRKRGFALSRMYYVGLTAGERFYLRTLLTVVKGPKSFQDLRTFRGTTYPTFCDACIARGLLENDGEWQQCLEEASAMQTGHQLRQLFATILNFCSPTNPAMLWANFRQHICDDLRHRLMTFTNQRDNITDDEVFDFGLYLLNGALEKLGTSLQNFDMPQPLRNWGVEAENRYIAEHSLSYNRDDEQIQAAAHIPLLNQEQKDAFS